MTELRTVPFHRALHRPNLLLGGERELVLTTALVAGGLAVSALNVPAALISAAIWLFCIAGLRMMAKADPHMSRVYLRFMKYARYYPARSRPFTGDTMSAAGQWTILIGGLAGIVLLLWWAS